MEKREKKQIKRAQTGRTVGDRDTARTSLARIQIFFSPFLAGLFFKVVWSLWLFQSVGVVAVWDGCHHTAGKTGGAAAVPTSEDSQAEGNETIISGDDREKHQQNNESGFRGYCWLLLLCLCCSHLLQLFTFLFLNEIF